MREDRALQLLCELTLNSSPHPQMLDELRQLSSAERDEFLRLANSHHVIIRGLQPVKAWSTAAGDTDLCRWAEHAIATEQARVDNALAYLQEICRELEAAGCPATVMKSLDHYPDIGSDLDLYTTAKEHQVKQVMRERFSAVAEARSWGDRVAQKHNFKVPGLPESVEIHVQRLGQMGEHTALARRFVTRRVEKTVNGRTFFVPAPEERIIVATLQRMYRHFYFRICDIVNSAGLIDSGAVDFAELKKAAQFAGIWPGVASYLKIVSDFVEKYRGRGLELPTVVTRSAICSGDDIYPRKDFLRVPIVPKGASLYTQQVTHAAFSGDVPGTFRLGLLPYLASAAAISYKLTGSDKGIW
jgi:hypothetical protein